MNHFQVKSIWKTQIAPTSSSNQDSILSDEKLGIFCVADGIGGIAGGATASKMAANGLINEVEHLRVEHNRWIDENVGTVLNNLNRRILDYGLNNAGLLGLGTTLSGLIAENRSSWWLIHTGDSRVYGMTLDDEMVQLTRDQTLAEERINIGLSDDNKTRTSKAANTLTNYLGSKDFTWHVRLINPGDYSLYLLCTDGLTKWVENDNLTDIILKHKYNHNLLCDQLISTARTAGSLDDISVILVKTEQAGK